MRHCAYMCGIRVFGCTVGDLDEYTKYPLKRALIRRKHSEWGIYRHNRKTAEKSAVAAALLNSSLYPRRRNSSKFAAPPFCSLCGQSGDHLSRTSAGCLCSLFHRCARSFLLFLVVPFVCWVFPRLCSFRLFLGCFLARPCVICRPPYFLPSLLWGVHAYIFSIEQKDYKNG